MPAAWYPKSLPCDVTVKGISVNVDCTERKLKEMPIGIPGNVTNITLTINHIPHIETTSFQGLESLVEIDFRCNCVPIKIGPKDRVCSKSVTIDDKSFWHLKKLKSLYLDGNQLLSIPRGLPPGLTLLSLEVNHIHIIRKKDLSELANIEVLYFGQNCYYRNPCNVSYDIEKGAFSHLINLTVLSLKANNLSYVPQDLPVSLKELYLYNNNIRNITEEDFRNLTNLETLDLSGNCPRCYNAPFPCTPCPGNGDLHIDNSAFQTLNKLTTLRLHSNSLKMVKSEWFQATDKLQVLDLSSNFLAKHITDTTFPMHVPTLVDLDLSFNYELQQYPASLNLSSSFSSLTLLNVLRIRGFVFQQLTKKDIRPLIGLRHLERIDLGTNFIKMTNLMILTELKNIKIIILDLSENKFDKVPDELSNCTKSIKKLILHHNQISKLTPHFLRAAYSLKYLDLSYNEIEYIQRSSFPEDVIDHLDMLLLHGNKFMCSCKAIWFVMWINKTMVNIPKLATEVNCANPGYQIGKSIITLSGDSCQHSSLSIILYVFLTSLTLGVLTLSITAHLFLWDMWYIYYFCLAKMKGYSRLSSQSSIYDAFIIYDKKDPAVSDWVMEELQVNLEEQGDPPLQLCLEERDWLPGCPIIDNLCQSIQQSRKTVFVLTKKYVLSGNFKTAFYLAHQRLFDEKADVILLIFLEKLPLRSKYLRLRKRLYGRSLLEWPSNPKAQPYFWHCLRSAMAKDSHGQYSKLFQETL
ncbi:toll-like receptor 7 [Conger conger]|uniref:toll-like receptor 7 n=1 Tax=Conger conger TaxID=82655 RepID=UPI002A5A8F52|nr:toll-like receptor 7 [Conger conger]